MRRVWHRVATAAVAVVALGAVSGCGSSAADVDPGQPIYLSAGGDDSSACSEADPCKSFSRAYRAASPGQSVLVAAGTYPEQTLTGGDEKLGTERVVFRPAEGANVRLESLEVDGPRVELRGFTVGTVTTLADAEDVVLRDLTIRGGFFILSSRRVSVVGGSVGPGVDYHPMIASADRSTTPPRDIVVDGVLFHDWTRTKPEVHTECLQIGAGDGITVRNSRFRNCHVMDLHVTHFGDAPETRNVTIENNFFSAAGDGGFYAIQANAFENLLVRNNSLAQPVKIFTGPGQGPNVNVRVIGNVGPNAAWGCERGVIYRYNVWDGAKCHATDRDAPTGFVDAAAGDFHLRPGSAAIGRGDPAAHPARDIDGDPRPSGAAPDAGADEHV
jgi:hypothetical protein